jgi:NitT/TauT family transport system substrate-binding protein
MLTRVLIAAVLVCAGPAFAAGLKVGMVRTSAGAPIYIGVEKGAFAAAGCPVELAYFDSAQPVAVAAVAGAIDIGESGLTGGFYSLAGQGELKIISSSTQEMRGFQFLGFMTSNHAWDGGLRSLKDLAGHSFAVTQLGTALVYSLYLASEKYGFDFKSVRLMPLQSNTNAISAIASGQVDATDLPVNSVMALVSKGDAHLLGWVGDEFPGMQGNGVFTPTKGMDERAADLRCFLKVYVESTHEFYDAFVGPGEVRRDGPNAAADIAIIAKYTGAPPETVKQAIPYFDRDERVNVKDVLRQIAWYKSQGLLKPELDGNSIFDRRYIAELP